MKIDDMLVLKLLLTPALIGLVSLMSRRWGPAISGWFVGLPLTSGPVALYLALDQGTTFAASAAQGTLLGLISVANFCLTYSWASLRITWWGSLLIRGLLPDRNVYSGEKWHRDRLRHSCTGISVAAWVLTLVHEKIYR